MINITDKKECNGCCACVDVCPTEAISLVTDHEGFWYPLVDETSCVDCSLCDGTCPEIESKSDLLHMGEAPVCYAAIHKDLDTRLDSTSGGIFSALAEAMFAQGGNLAGAVYREDFSVQHIITKDPGELYRLRSSKYLQSNCEGLYKGIRERLSAGEKMLVCGCPCQMAGLRLFLEKDYENLIIVDFICRGINSPKVFRKHLDSLEEKNGSKVLYAKAKNKEHGWRSLTFKAVFENGRAYYGDGNEDDFTRGYLQTGYYVRPSCFDCKFKEILRIADITIADFWGAENVCPNLDDNKGTSLIMCNTAKGRTYFDSIGDKVQKKEVSVSEIAPGNRSLYCSIDTPQHEREAFFLDLDRMSYSNVAEKYFPKKKKQPGVWIGLLKRLIRKILFLQKTMGLSPKVWWQFVWLNFLRHNTTSNLFKMNVFVPTRYCIFDIHPSAEIVLKGLVTFGVTKVKGSRMETRLLLEENAKLIVNDVFFAYADADIQVFKGGELTFEGGQAAGCNIHCQIVCADSIRIGRSTLIGRNVILRDYDAHYIIQKGYKVKAPISIGDHCWLGDGVMVSKGVTIGDGSIVAARSWVISKVGKKMLVAGSPAMPMKKNIEWKV